MLHVFSPSFKFYITHNDFSLILEGVSFCTLARESRLVLILNGYTVQKTDNNDNNSNESQIVKEELGWTAFQFFNYEG